MKYKLSDICEYAKGKVAVETLDERTYISTENMLPNKGGIDIASSLPTISQTQEYMVGDVLVSNIRPYFKKIWHAEFEGGCSNDVLVFRAKDGTDPDFLYYVLANDEFFDYSMATSKGTKMPRGDKKALMEYEVPNYPLRIQRKIASLLKSIDGKIAINSEINKNLLQQALCLYSSLIGESAKNGCIGDYCSIKSGFAFKSKWWQDSGVPVVKIGSINQDYLNLSDCSYVSDDKITYANDFIVFGGDLLIAMTGATIGKFTMVPKVSETILVNQRVGKFFLGEKPVAKLPFIYCTLKQPDIISELINRGQGSAQPNISATDIMTIPCVIPNTDEIDKFNRELSPMFEMIINNQYGNTMLSNTRDVILPKLMSGELDVSALNSCLKLDRLSQMR